VGKCSMAIGGGSFGFVLDHMVWGFVIGFWPSKKDIDFFCYILYLMLSE